MYGKLKTIVNNNFLKVPLAFAEVTVSLLEKHRLLNYRSSEYFGKMLRSASCWASRYSFACQKSYLRAEIVVVKGIFHGDTKQINPFFRQKKIQKRSRRHH